MNVWSTTIFTVVFVSSVVQSGVALSATDGAPAISETFRPQTAPEKIHIVVMNEDSVPTWFKKEFPDEAFSPTDSRGLSYGQTVLDHNLETLKDHGVTDEMVIDNLCFAGAMAMARLSDAKANELRGDPRVRAVMADEIIQLQTNTSPGFLGLERRFSPWDRGVLGENVVVGILDSGINPEHPSFANEMIDINISGDSSDRSRPYPAPPARWNGDGTCDFGNRERNQDDAPFRCNNKLLAARSYREGFGELRIARDEFFSARDADDHGTHVASTAAGNFGVPAEINGRSMGTISGIAPRARLSIYKVCWNGPPPPPGQDPTDGCSRADTISAIEQAIVDGVDVINFSVGGSSTVFGPEERAWLSAADAGIWVATSQGNDGPGANTVGTPSGVPWITSVGAIQDSGVFILELNVTAPAVVAGTSEAAEGSGPVSFADTGLIEGDIVQTQPPLGCTPPSNDLTGKIALVLRGECTFTEKYTNAAAAGARMILIYNDGANENRIDPIFMSVSDATIPGAMVSFFVGAAIAEQLDNDEEVRGNLGPQPRNSAENRIASFSSRGPNGGAPDIIKPDISAPGVIILAAGTPFTAPGPDDGQLFATLSGTSMSSPHIAGVFALIHQVHADWSPAMARSAVMTTARQNLSKNNGRASADPFDVGSGLVVPQRALRPGLVYDAGENDYLAFSCETNVSFANSEECDALREQGFSTDPTQLNLSSIGVSDLSGQKTVRRTVTSVLDSESEFRVSVNAPRGIRVEVDPPELELAAGESATYEVTFTAEPNSVLNEWVFGSLTWFNDNNSVRSPIAVLPTARATP